MQLAGQSPAKGNEDNCATAAKPSRVLNKLDLSTFEVGRNWTDTVSSQASKRDHQHIDASIWVEERVRAARSTQIHPSVQLLIIETPASSEQRGRYSELLTLTEVALKSLGISSSVLGMFGSVVFEKSFPDIFDFKPGSTNAVPTFAYHVALGDFSLAFRFFPASKTCVGIMLVQDYRDVVTELLNDLDTHRALIGEPLLLPLLAQKAMAKITTS